MERDNLKAILKENQLNATGLIDPETAKKLGKLKAVDAIIVGSIFPFGDNLRVNIKILDTETGMNIGGAIGSFARTDALNKLFDTKLILASGSHQSTPSNSNSEIRPIPEKISEKIEGGDVCFKNIDRVGYNANVSIYKAGKSEPLNSISVNYGDKSCVYELPMGVYKAVITWSDRWGNNIPTSIKDIKIKAGTESLVEIYH